MGNATAEIIRLNENIEKLRAALKPFADRVYNDNGDVTYNTGNHLTEDYWRAYKAMKQT